MISVRESAVLIIFLASISAIVVRPSRFPEWLAALAGVAAMLVFGVESAADAWHAVASQWDVLLFFAGLMTVVAVAEAAGFFSWVAFVAANAARGSSRRLFVAVVVACAIIAALLTNDAAALLMTPLVFSLAHRLGLRPLPYAFACTFMANGASLFLPISNPVNVMIAEAANLDLSRYSALLWLPALGAAVATALVLWSVLGSKLRRRFDAERIAPPDADRRYVTEVGFLLGLTALALVAVTAASGLVGVAACSAALVMLVHAALRKRLDAGRILSDANPSIIVLVAGLFALAEGVVASGLLSAPIGALVRAAQLHAGLAGLETAAAAAAASNVLNNLPAAALLVATLHHGSMPASIASRVAAGAIIGCDLGPNLTTVGSLSTMLWLVLLRRRGLDVSSLAYVKVGLLVAPASLAVALVLSMLTMR